jgi:sterol desaturase/sphingolipid hydroxylase (fatty acid hydroxylase superfamily)
MATNVSSLSVTVQLLTVMLVASIILTIMSLAMPPYTTAEWYCYDETWSTGICTVPCGLPAGTRLYQTTNYWQHWCCNAYTCWKEGGVQSSPGPQWCAFC